MQLSPVGKANNYTIIYKSTKTEWQIFHLHLQIGAQSDWINFHKDIQMPKRAHMDTWRAGGERNVPHVAFL